MNMRWAASLPMWTFLAFVVLGASARAQVPAGPHVYSPETPVSMMGGGPGGAPPGYGGMGGMPMGGMPGDPYGGMAGGGMPGDPYGGMAGGGMPGGEMYGGEMYGGEGMPEDCGPGRGLCRDLLGLIGPYADGGCCAPRYFDLSVEAMWLQRDNAGRNVVLASEGIGGNTALETNMFRFDERPSFRLSAWIQFRSMGNIEFNYFGLFNHKDTVQVDDPNNNLFSALSQFGTVPFGGFNEDGFANRNRMAFSADFDNFEVNYRRHWQGPDCRLQGSVLFGARYFKLDESFDYISQSDFNGAMMQYHVDTFNSVVGAQTGGDIWVCIIPGLRAGFESKFGVYGNHSHQATRIEATSLLVPYTETRGSDDVAFVGDAAAYVTYRINYQLNLKLGYNAIFVDGVSLATENFNAAPPNVFFPGGGREPTNNDNGQVFYTGASIGLEYNW